MKSHVEWDKGMNFLQKTHDQHDIVERCAF